MAGGKGPGQLYEKEYTGCCGNVPGRATTPRSSNSSVWLIFKLRSLEEVTHREKPQREGEVAENPQIIPEVAETSLSRLQSFKSIVLLLFRIQISLRKVSYNCIYCVLKIFEGNYVHQVGRTRRGHRDCVKQRLLRNHYRCKNCIGYIVIVTKA